MAEFLQIHPKDPQPRLIAQAAEIIRKGGLAAFPTDSAYAWAAMWAMPRCWNASGAFAGWMIATCLP